jgi:hypothetical protein
MAAGRTTHSYALAAASLIALVLITVVVMVAPARVDARGVPVQAPHFPSIDFAAAPVVGDGGGGFATGSTQAIAWTMTAAPPAGAIFMLVGDNPGASINVLLGTVPAGGGTAYSYDWTIAQGPSLGWLVTVQLWSGGSERASRDSQTFDILPATYDITVASGANGAISPGTGPVATHSSPTYTITPNSGYHVLNVLVDGSSVGAVTSYQFRDVKAVHTIAATFAADPFGMPTTSVEGARRAWSKRPVKLAFTGHPGVSGAAIAFVEYSLGGGPWVKGIQATGASVTVVAQGTTRVDYRSQDVDGTLEAPARACTLRIDSRRPRVLAQSASGRAFAATTMRLRASDPLPSCGSALVRAVVVDADGRALTRASTVPVSTNRWRSLRLSTGMPSPGCYTVVLRAMDRAGNFQRGVTHARLRVY